MNYETEILLVCNECDKEKVVRRCVYETIEPLDEAVRVESLCMECRQGTKGGQTYHFDEDDNEIFYGPDDINKWPDNAMEKVEVTNE